jgi:tripartite-type tricarboxylate transporter receptor subunit TctC
MRIAVTLLLCVLAPAVVAQSFPAKPLRIVVRAPPGGTDELLGRLIAPKMGALLGQPVAVDYRTGAAGLAASFAPISSRSPRPCSSPSPPAATSSIPRNMPTRSCARA